MICTSSWSRHQFTFCQIRTFIIKSIIFTSVGKKLNSLRILKRTVITLFLILIYFHPHMHVCMRSQSSNSLKIKDFFLLICLWYIFLTVWNLIKIGIYTSIDKVLTSLAVTFSRWAIIHYRKGNLSLYDFKLQLVPGTTPNTRCFLFFKNLLLWYKTSVTLVLIGNV